MSDFGIRTPLLHLALLETLKADEIQDEIDLFLPFIAVTASEIGKQVIDEIDIQENLLNSFGFKPPIAAVRVLMTRAKNRGLLIKENNAFIPCHEKIIEWKNGYEHKQEDVSTSLRSLKQEFVNFTLEQFQKNLTMDDAEKFILRFIEQNVSSVLSERAYRKSELNATIKNSDHLIASFISYIHRSQPALLEHFSRCVKGMLLANYLFYADKVSDKQSYTGITVYLDSPIVLGLLGYSGKQANEAYSDFIKLLNSLNITICIFDRTLDEIEGLLNAWKSDLSRKHYGRFNTKTLEWLKSSGFDAARLDTEIKLLPKKISQTGINIIQGFKAKPHFQCDENALESAIARRFSPNKNYEHDTICISRVHNQREGKSINSLNQKFSVFVTHNTILQRIAYEFFRKELGRETIPIVVSEQWMTAMFWLKRPDIYGHLPQEQLLSTAYSLLYTDDKFWESFLERLEKIQKRGGITEEDFLRIRWDSDLLKLVHKVSVDVGEDFSEEDIFDVVAKINEKHEEKHLAEIEKLQINQKGEIERIRSNANFLIETAENQKYKAEDRLEKLERKIKKSSMIFSKIIAWSFTAICLMALVFTALKSIPLENQPEIFKIDNPVITIGVILTISLGLMASIFGKDLSFFHNRIRTSIERKLINLILDK